MLEPHPQRHDADHDKAPAYQGRVPNPQTDGPHRAEQKPEVVCLRQPSAACDRHPASCCIIGRIGVKAKRPMPIATAMAVCPAKATVIGEGTRAGAVFMDEGGSGAILRNL